MYLNVYTFSCTSVMDFVIRSIFKMNVSDKKLIKYKMLKYNMNKIYKDIWGRESLGYHREKRS